MNHARGAQLTALPVGDPPPLAELLALADRSVGSLLEQLLPGSGLIVKSDSESFALALKESRPRLVVLVSPPSGPADMRLVIRERELGPGFGTVLLSDHESIAPRLHALQLGFDDAVDLSADPIEISARLSTAGRGLELGSRLALVAPEVQLDLWARSVWRNGQARRLRPRDFELLKFLVDRPGQALSRKELLTAWPGSTASARMVDVTIWRLRALIEQDSASPAQLVTVPRLGYRYDPPAVRR